MTEVQLKEFYHIAENAGQDSHLLNQGEPQKTYWHIHTMEQARQMLSRAGQQERELRSRTFLKGLEYRSRIAQGMHDRGEAYVFANHPLESEKDKGGHNNHMPIYVRTWSMLYKMLEANEEWDLSLYPSEWGVDDKEEMYNIVNIGTLVLHENSRIIVRGNAFIFTCQQIIKVGIENQPFDIGILGTKHGFGNRLGDFDGADGQDGSHGEDGKHGIPPAIGNSFLGPILFGKYDIEKANGQDGENGQAGTNGENGLNGGACRITEINLRQIISEKPVAIGVIPGTGGNGGHGGNGGNGGHGGQGTDAFKTIDGWIPAGHGGKGGHGGRGGRGGRAGNGGISSNVLINIPEKSKNYIEFYSMEGRPGLPGRGGKSGVPGNKGMNGLNANQKRDQQNDSINQSNDGKDGREGRIMPAAKIYLNNEWVNSQTIDKL